MKPSLLPYLACISCKGQFILQEDESVPMDNREGREIITGSLTCKSCLQRFAITHGIPRMVDPSLSSSTDLNTGERFANAWKEFSRLDERYKQQFYDWIFPVDPDFMDDKIVLEAGVGKGRHAQIVVESGAKLVFGIDIGNAIDVAYKNVGHLPKVHLIQADIRQLPFNNIFDFAFSVGVLHHMDDPEAGFSSVARTLRPGGALSIWVYGKENNWWITNLVCPLRKAFTSNLPTGVLKVLSTTLSIPVYLNAKFISSPWTRLQQSIPWLPDLFYQSYMNYISRFDFTEINHIVFDHLTAPVAFYVARESVISWFQKNEFMNPVIRWHNKNSWSAFASHRDYDMDTMSKRLQKANKSTLRQRAFVY